MTGDRGDQEQELLNFSVGIAMARLNSKCICPPVFLLQSYAKNREFNWPKWGSHAQVRGRGAGVLALVAEPGMEGRRAGPQRNGYQADIHYILP